MRISDWSSDVCSSDLPAREAEHALVFFPGSTLGTFTHAESLRLLRAMRETTGERGGALVGIDLQKSPAVLQAAYNDAAGLTAAFTLHLLPRLNRDIGRDFDLHRLLPRAAHRSHTLHVGKLESR